MIAQMFPGMEALPLLAMLLGLAVGLIALFAWVAVGSVLICAVFRRPRTGVGTYSILIAVFVAALWLILPKPIESGRVTTAAKPGRSADQLIFELGEPHGIDGPDQNGCRVLLYYEDCIGVATTCVRVDAGGAVVDSWYD